MRPTLLQDLQALHDQIQTKQPLLAVATNLVTCVRRHVNPEAPYIYLMLHFGNYQQLLAGYDYETIHFHDPTLTPMQNAHRWNKALKAIEDRPGQYYTIVDDHLTPLTMADLLPSYQTLLTNLVALGKLHDGQRTYFNRGLTPHQTIVDLNDQLHQPQLYWGFDRHVQ